MSQALTLGEIALGEFRRRQAKADELVKAGQLDRGPAEASLRPWCAIACRLGVNLPELEQALAARSDQDPWLARALIADEICPRGTWIPALAVARDRAVGDAHDNETIARARGLLRLARHFTHDLNRKHHLPPFRDRAPAAREKAA